MDTFGSNVYRLRLEAGWTDHVAAYDASKALGTPIKPHQWANVESRDSGPQGPSLRTLRLFQTALSAGLGRQVTLDELCDEPAGADARVARTDQGTAARQRRRSGNPRSSRSSRKDA